MRIVHKRNHEAKERNIGSRGNKKERKNNNKLLYSMGGMVVIITLQRLKEYWW